MLYLKNIHPLSDFLRNAKSFLSRMKRTGEPEILTVNGDAQAVILSAAAYEELIEELETIRTQNISSQNALELFRTGRITADELARELRPVPEALGIPVDQAFAELRRKIQHRRKKKAS